MQILTFMILFMLLTIVSSIFIVSFYEITRHYIEIQPDGKETVEGYVLKRWSWYWEYIKKTRRVYYETSAIDYKLSELKRLLPVIGNRLTRDGLGVSELAFYVKEGYQEITEDEISKIEAIMLCKVYVNGIYYFMYIDEPVYLFPSIIRKPVSSCVRCMASLYGSIIWVSFNYLYNAFAWTNHKIFAYLFFWCIFVVLLAKTNDFIYKKTYV